MAKQTEKDEDGKFAQQPLAQKPEPVSEEQQQREAEEKREAELQKLQEEQQRLREEAAKEQGGVYDAEGQAKNLRDASVNPDERNV
jgi:hypothetical protein